MTIFQDLVAKIVPRSPDVNAIDRFITWSREQIEKIRDALVEGANNLSDLADDVAVIDTDLTALAIDVAAAEADIVTLQTDLNTAESNITTLQTDLNTAESNISTLQTDLNTAEADIDTLEALLSHGIYTPTLTNVTNVAASTAYSCQYMRIGNTVTVSGRCDIDATAAGGTLTELGISLPIASDLGALEHCCGIMSGRNINEVGAILGDAANDRASIQYAAQTLTNHGVTFTFTYRII